MSEQKAIAHVFKQSDEAFFRQHRDRKYHIRNAYDREMEGEFWSLGEHQRNRRRILLTRVDFEQKPFPENRVLKIPFLAFGDESIEDTDDVLYPIIYEIMQLALKEHGKQVQ